MSSRHIREPNPEGVVVFLVGWGVFWLVVGLFAGYLLGAV